MTTTMASTDNLCDEVRTMLMQRHATYGDSKDVFKKTAGLWSCHLSIPLVAKDVMVMLIAFKLSSLHQNSSPERTHDVLCDVVGYAVIISLVLTHTGNILIFVLTALICYIILLLLLFRWKTYFVDPEIKDS